MQSRIKDTWSKRIGSSLVIILMAVVVLALLGMAILRVGLSSRILAIRDCQAVEARCAADAGLTKALYEMNEKLRTETWSDDSLPAATLEAVPAADVVFDYTVSGDDSSGYSVQAVGYRNQSQKAVSATIKVKTLFQYAVLVKTYLSMKDNTLIDGYNSEDSSITDVDLQIATTSTAADQIDLKSGVNIDGDVLVGVGGDPATVIRDGGATTGDRSAMTEEEEFPVITPPALSNMGEIDVKGTTLTIGPSDSGKYTNFSVAQTSIRIKGVDYYTPGVIVVDGGAITLHVTGDIIVGESCEVLIQAGSDFALYVDGDIDCRANSNIGYQGTPEEPEHLKIYGTGIGPNIYNIKAKSNWSGVVYAPNADVQVYALGDIYGAFTANHFDFKSGGNFYYDEALREGSVYDEGVRFEIRRWRGD